MTLLEKIVVLAGIVVFLGTSCAACFHGVLRTVINPSQSTQKYYPSIAMAITVPVNEETGSVLATAWAVDEDHLFTAGHFCNAVDKMLQEGLIEPEINLVMSGRDGIPIYTTKAVVLAYEYNEQQDHCILLSEDHPFLPLELSSKFSLVETEDPVIIVGAPQGFFPVKIDGYVAQKEIYQMEIKGKMLISAQAEPGNSGSPVLWNGEVIGMVVAGFPWMADACIVVPVPVLKKFFKDVVGD